MNGRLNQELSNAPWKSKRTTLAEHTVLYINKNLLDIYGNTDWTEATIRKRGVALADVMKRIWLAGPAPLS